MCFSFKVPLINFKCQVLLSNFCDAVFKVSVKRNDKNLPTLLCLKKKFKYTI